MKKELSILILLLLSCGSTYAQRSIGIHYFGELGLHPGLEIDYGLPILHKNIPKEKRILSRQLDFRPSIAYYHLPKYTHNFLLTPSINYQLRSTNSESQKYLFAEPTIKLGYMRYSYIGEIYESTPDGFEEKNRGGGNAFVFGSGLNLGGSLKPNQVDWIFGVEYLAELSEDGLFINHINFKLGVRHQLIKK
jgi:hypothetical protein